MENFLRKKFEFDLEVLEYHTKLINENNFLIPKENYLITYDFLINSLNNVKDIDPEILDSLGEKLYEDITSLYNFYLNWKKKKSIYHEYFLEYMNTLTHMKEKYQQINDLKDQMKKLNTIIKKTDKLLNSQLSEEEKKKIKKQNVDAIYEYSLVKDKYFKLKSEVDESEKEKEKIFKSVFEEFCDSILSELKKILNIKIFYLAKYYSMKLKESYLLKKFAIVSGLELSLFSLSNYFYKHISNVNTEKIKELIKGIE